MTCLVLITWTTMYSNTSFCNLSFEDKVCQLEELQAEEATDELLSLIEIMDKNEQTTLMKKHAYILKNHSINANNYCDLVFVRYSYDPCGSSGEYGNIMKLKYKIERLKCGTFWGPEIPTLVGAVPC